MTTTTTDNDKNDNNNGISDSESPVFHDTEHSPFQMESIFEGQRAGHGLSSPELEQQQEPQEQDHHHGGHHHHRRGGSRGGHHSRSDSLVDSLADVLDVLTLIDEVEAEPVNDHNDPSNRGGGRHGHGHGHSRDESLAEGFLEEAKDVAEAFVEELNEADDGDTFFLDMSLVRNISILPDDMVRVAEATAPEALFLQQQQQTASPSSVSASASATEDMMMMDPEKLPLIEKNDATMMMTSSITIPLSAYILLATAVVALSSIGPLLNLQGGIHPVLKVYWRMSATAMILGPFAAYSVYNEGLPQTLDAPQRLTLLITAACYATMCVGFVLALEYTAVGNAVILANSQSVLLLVGKLFVGQRILPLEAAGAVLAFVGAALCSTDSAQSGEGGGRGGEGAASGGDYTTLWGDFLALVSATGGVFYLVFAKTVRPHVSLFLFMFLIMFLGSTMILIFMFTLSTSIHITFDRNLVTGIWGWMNPQSDRLPLELTMVVMCNLFGAMGYVRAMQYFDNLVISVAALLEPAVAELTAVALGVGVLPGTMGWAGNAMVAFGTFAVVYPSVSSGKGGGGH
jgi:drug/metabolite transporter (DMT)-like permease